MIEQIEIVDRESLDRAAALVGARFTDMSTYPPRLVFADGVEDRYASFGDTVTRHPDGRVEVAKTDRQGELF